MPDVTVPGGPGRFDVGTPRDLGEIGAIRRLLGDIWGEPDEGPPEHLLVALRDFGGVVLRATAREGGALVGAAYGFFGRHEGEWALHSHTVGVVAPWRGRGVGRALKFAQRDAARAAGAAAVTWTFDPLLRSNAGFNLGVLGAVANRYLPDCYGPLHDAFNEGDETDRLLVRWDVAAGTSPVPSGEPSAATTVAPRLVDVDPDGRPVRTAVPGDTSTLLLAVPADVVALRRAEAPLAREWRLAVRAAFAEAFAGGYVATGFTRDGAYVLTRAARRPS